MDLKDKYIQMASNRDDFNHISNSNFILPDMGEMVQEDLMTEIYQQYKDGNTDAEYKEKEALDKHFYTEEPFTTVPGHYSQEGAFVLRVKNKHHKKISWDLNKYDGDTIDFRLEDIDDGGETIVMSKHENQALTYKNFKEYFRKMGGGDSIQIRFIGIDTAEIPHYEIQPVPKNSNAVKTMTYKEMLNMKSHNDTILYEKHPYDVHSRELLPPRKDEDKVKLLLVSKENGKKSYTEIIERMDAKKLLQDSNPGFVFKEDHDYYVVIGQDESESNKISDGYEAQIQLRKVIEESSEIMLVLNANGIAADRNPIMTGKTFNSFYYFPDIVRYLVDQWDAYYGNLALTNYNYIPYGMDNYKRSLGVIYAKYKGEWINVNKYVLCNTEKTIANPKFNDSPELQDINSGLSDSFNLWSYNRDNIEWLDSFEKIAADSYQKKMDLHKEITGMDFTQARDCGLMIGDTLMLIPPQSIRNVTQVMYERIPNMRSKGTMAKDKENALHMLEITLYFYEEAGINGIEHTFTTPNGKTFTYKMNGLRSLIAQFKVAPFLPIENGYINDVLGIEAVSLQNLNISNVEGFPRLLKVVLTLQEFNYRIYMPDMPIRENKEESMAQMSPMFAKSFNWEIFRYYYQRAIMAGDDLAEIEKDGGYASYSYNLKYYASKNSIGPWLFCGPLSNKGEISFFIPDEDWLNNALQVKKEKDNLLLTPDSSVELTPAAKDYVSKLAKLANNIKKIKNGEVEEFNDALDNFIGKAVEGKHEIELRPPLIIGEKGYKSENIEATALSSIEIKTDGTSLTKTAIRDEYILPIKKAFMDAVNDASYFSNLTINETITKDVNKVYYATWDFVIKLNKSNITDEDLRSIKEIASKRTDDSTIEDIFNNDSITISYKMSFKKDGLRTHDLNIWDSNGEEQYKNTFMPIPTDDEISISALIAHLEDTDVEDELEDIKDDPINEYNREVDFYVKDYKNPANMPFVPYVENVLCKNMMGNLANTFTEVSIKAIEGKGPQYMGGQDAQLEFELITDDLTIVGAINALPTLASAMAKKYRRILPAWPIKIHSDLTRMLGISEVLIDMVEVNTVEGFPGIYSISMRLTSVDRTQRQREALRRLDVAPQGGKVGYNHNSDLSMNTYFSIDNALAQAELYPDLDLPSIKELGELGYRFVKYSGQHRSYPDPDFYILYNYPYTSLIIKKMIKDVLTKNLLNTEGEDTSHLFKFKDVMGMELTGKIEAYTGISLSSLDNDNAKSYNDIMNNLEASINEKLQNNKGLTKEKAKKITDQLELVTAIKKLVMADVNDGWEVRPSWRAPLAGYEIDNAIKDISSEKSNAFAQEIKERRQEAIKLIDNILSQPLTFREYEDYSNNTIDRNGNEYKLICEEAVNDLFGKGDGLKLLQLLCPGVQFQNHYGTGMSNTFFKSYFNDPEPLAYLIGYLFASGCALSADKEYAPKVDKKDWYPNQYIASIDRPTTDIDKNSRFYGKKLPFCVSEKIAGSSKVISTIEDGIANGTIFGAWRINKYSNPNIVVEMMGAEGDIKYTDKDNDTPFKRAVSAGFVDPYYNGLEDSSEEMLRYKETILTNRQSNAEAFLRTVLLSLRKMICDGLLISEIDIVANDWFSIVNKELEIKNPTMNDPSSSSAAGSNGVLSNGTNGTIPYPAVNQNKDTNISAALQELGFDEEEIKKIMLSIKKSAARSFCARLIYPFIMTVTESNRDLYDIIKNRDYSALNGLTSYVEYGAGVSDSKTRVIKFLSALSGINLSLEKSGKNDTTISESQKLMNGLMKDVFIKASEDPRAYLVHSFYDMLTNDKRGRLVRAFPTYYVVFVDEGRKMGSWKLHDNFYNMNSISSINVVKSRKIASDTCTIVMNNMFNSYTMEPDSTTTQQYTDIYGLRDVFDSIFSPKAYFDKEKRIRLRKTIPDTVVLQPGIRIHVRMGYSADGSKLPIVFNGKVAEVEVAEVAQLIAQGDGHELMNPLNAFGEIEALSLDAAQSDITWFKDVRGALASGGESPRDLLAKLLIAKYGGWRKAIDKISDGRWFNDNPFGIMHFGDPKFTNIFEQGEIVQNLYEVSDSTLLKGVNDFDKVKSYKKLTPTINTSIQDKTLFDILHLCANSGANYIGAIRDFGFRSTIFLGKPNHYYAYGYELIDNKIVEKRKPFQQFHYYDSYTDIVYNSIKASEAQMKTNAVGLWQASSMLWGREQETVGPIYLDMNIYPEYQKSMTVDTGLLGSGNGGVDLGVTTHFGEKYSTSVYDDKVNKSLAWRVTANTLRDSVKDMYLGDLCVLGDPSVKPYDRVYLHDTYEDMLGQFEVEAVVHNMSVETGFSTSIMPDVIARHEDSFEVANQSLLSAVGGMLGLAVATPIIDNLWGAAVHGKLTTLIAKSDKMYDHAGKLSKVANSLYDVTGMKGFLEKNPTAKSVFSKFNVFPETKATTLEAIENSINYLSKVDIKSLDNIEDLSKALLHYTRIDTDKYLTSVYETFDQSNIGENFYSKKDIEKLMKEMKNEKLELDKLFDLQKFDAVNFTDDILKVTVDKVPLKDCASREVRNILDRWKDGKVGDSNEFLHDISKVLNDDDIKKAIVNKDLKLDKIDNFLDDFKNVFKVTDVDGKDVSRFAKAAKVLKGGDLLKDLTTTFRTLIKSNWVGLLIDLSLELTVTILTKNAQEAFTRFLQGIQAVDVYPLKKNNKPLIAGMNGHKGSVYGWPVKEGYDSIQGMIMEFTNMFKGNFVTDWILDLFVDENIFERLCSKWNADLGLSTNEQMSQEELAQTTYQNVSSMYAANNKHAYALMVVPRISKEVLESDGSLDLLNEYKITNISPMSIPNNERILKLNFISNNPVIRKAIADKRFEIAHAEKSDYIINIPFESGTQGVPAKINDGVIDMPLVQEELMLILEHLLSHEKLKNKKIIFKSGIRVNENPVSWKNTGFAMILEINKSGGKDLEEVLKDFERTSNIVQNSDGLFSFVVKGDKATIIALPPSKVKEKEGESNE